MKKKILLMLALVSAAGAHGFDNFGFDPHQEAHDQEAHELAALLADCSVATQQPVQTFSR